MRIYRFVDFLCKRDRIILNNKKKGCEFMRPTVDKEKCTGCEKCLEICPAEAIIMKNEKAYVTIECVECGACIPECPENALVCEEEYWDN